MLICPRCSSIYAGGIDVCKNDGTPLLDDPTDPLIGRSISHYRIEARLGRGAAGCVYRAKGGTHGRDYAVKVLFGEVAAEREHVQRFRREAEVTSRIDHPNVVAIADFGATPEGLVFLAMELVAGRPLSDLIGAQGPFDVVRTSMLMRQIALGLAAAHDLGYVHRDLKPANVMVVGAPPSEQAKILDFGIVGLRASNADVTRLTRPGFTLGTPRFMAPEQFRDASVGPAADLYALGCLGFTMVRGYPPFAGAPLELSRQHQQERPPHLDDCGPLGEIIEHLLRKSPSERPASAREVVALIEGTMLPDTTARDLNLVSSPTLVDPSLADPPRDGLTTVPAGMLARSPTGIPGTSPFASLAHDVSPRSRSWFTGAALAVGGAVFGGGVVLLALRWQPAPIEAPGTMAAPPAATEGRGPEPAPPGRDVPPPPPVRRQSVQSSAETQASAEAATSSLAPADAPTPTGPIKTRRRPMPASGAPAPTKALAGDGPASQTAEVEAVPAVSPAPSESSDGSGFINVVARRGRTSVAAEVFVDGSARGRAPLRLELRAGQHLVEIVTEAGERTRRAVTVRADVTGRVVADFAAR